MKKNSIKTQGEAERACFCVRADGDCDLCAMKREEISGFDTSHWEVRTKLYVDKDVPGALTAKPFQGNHKG